MAKEEGKQLEIYDSGDVRGEGVRYEVVKVPLQNQVATVRKALCTVYRETKAQWQRLQGRVRGAVSKTRQQTQDSLSSLGVRDPTLALEATAVGSAALVGFMAARKQSLFRRLLYPTLAVTVVGGTIYFSSAENRATFWSKASEVYKGGVASWKGRER